MVESRPSRPGLLFVCAAVVVLLASSARAQSEHSDIVLASQAGQLVIEGDDPVYTGTFFDPTSVAGTDYLVTGNPGFLGSPGDAPYERLPGDSWFSFSIAAFQLDGEEWANLWYWDGLDQDGDGDYWDDVRFAPVTPGTSFWVYRGSLFAPWITSGIASGEDTDVAGFQIEMTSTTGGLHEHPTFGVFGPAESPPAEGIYLVSFDLDVENLPNVAEVYLSFRSQNADEAANDAARQWVHDIVTVPEPSVSVGLLTGALALLGLRSDRARNRDSA